MNLASIRLWVAAFMASMTGGISFADSIDFENLSTISGVEVGRDVPPEAQLTSQLRATFGVNFSSVGGFAVAVQLGKDHATSGINGIAPANADGKLVYQRSTPIYVWFSDRSDPSIPMATDHVSVRGDLIGQAGKLATLDAFDVRGRLIKSDTREDVAGQTWEIDAPGIHSLRFRGVDPNEAGVGGIALDDLSFGPLRTVEAPKPIVIDFDRHSTMEPQAGEPVPQKARLSDRFASKFGVSFTSGSKHVAVLKMGKGQAVSGMNVIAPVKPDGRLTFDSRYPVVAKFVDPSKPKYQAVTNFVRVKGDLGGNSGQTAALEAYDVEGDLIERVIRPDSGGQVWEVRAPQIHSVRFVRLTPPGEDGGIALDDFTFHPVMAVDSKKSRQ